MLLLFITNLGMGGSPEGQGGNVQTARGFIKNLGRMMNP